MKPHPAEQRRFAVEVLRTLREAGHVAYWAGGCVRDELLGRTPKDFDVATAARPEQVRELFGQRRTLAIGAAFGVIAVVGSREAGNVEVTTFRRDAEYVDGRHPAGVTFTDAEEDARRRDFTMNAMFFDPLENRVIDFVGGQADIQRRVVRAVGDAHKRFDEDKLRMLRAVRFAATFGFALDAETAEAVRASAAQITVVSAERIAQELRGMLGKAGQTEAARLLVELNLASAVVPEVVPLPTLPMPGRDETCWAFTLDVLHRLEQRAPLPFPTALAALLCETGEAWQVQQAARRWKLSNDEREQAAWLVKHRDGLRDAPRRPWSQVQPLLAHALGGELLMLTEARTAALGEGADDVEFCRERRMLPREVLDPPPLLTGDDLVHMGLRPGKEFVRLLQIARDAQLDGTATSREAAETLVRSLANG